jgi:hypothetical protein
VQIPAAPEMSDAFHSFLRAQLGKPYDIEAIIAFIARRDWQQTDSWFCSELQAAALVNCGWFRRTAGHRIQPHHPARPAADPQRPDRHHHRGEGRMRFIEGLNWICMLGIMVAIETQIGNGSMSLSNMVPEAWIPFVKAWAANLGSIGALIMSAGVFGIQTSSNQAPIGTSSVAQGAAGRLPAVGVSGTSRVRG